MLARMKGGWIFHTGMQNDTATIKIVWQLSIELNLYHLAYDLASTLLGIYHREVKTHIYVHRSFNCNSFNLETTKIPLDRYIS